MRSRSLPSFLIGLALAWIPSRGGSIDSTIELLAKDAARGYISPMVSGFGAALNAGWFHKAPPAKLFDFGFEAGLVLMGGMLGEAPDRFQTRGSFQFDKAQSTKLVEPAWNAFNNDPRSVLLTPDQKQRLHDTLVSQLSAVNFNVGISGATVTGLPEDRIQIKFAGTDINVRVPPDGLNPGYDTTFSVPADSLALPVGGLLHDFPVLPLATPQFTIGTVAGTQLTFRILPELQLNPKFGSFKYFGFGIQHNPAAWLPMELPLDLSGGFFTQRLGIGKIFSAQSVAFGLNASKTLGWRFLNAIPYAGIMLERSTMRVKYDYEIDLPTGPVKRRVTFEAEGENNTRFTLGASVRLGILNLNLDYNLGAYDSFSSGLMIGI